MTGPPSSTRAVTVETIERQPTIGVAFADGLSDALVTDGLVVSARPAGSARPFRPAVTTPSGFHVFHGLPGLVAAGLPPVGPGERDSIGPDPSGPSIPVEVVIVDRQNRFLPTVVVLDAPLDRAAMAADAGLPASSPLDDMPIHLFSAPTRSLPDTVAAVRASLRHGSTLAPAGHAAVVVETPEGRHVGFADASGNVLVAFPYPAFTSPLPDGSPLAGSHGIPTGDHRWSITMEVRWQPSIARATFDGGPPPLHELYRQAPAAVLASEGAPPTSAVGAVLAYGEELVVATAGVTDPARRSYLLLEPAP